MGGMGGAVETATRLWRAMEERDWEQVESLLDADFESFWPQSGERFKKERYLEINRDYPGDWHIRVINVLDAGEWAVSEVEVDIDGRVDRAVSFFEVVDGRILRLREYWPEPMKIPEWRRSAD